MKCQWCSFLHSFTRLLLEFLILEHLINRLISCFTHLMVVFLFYVNLLWMNLCSILWWENRFATGCLIWRLFDWLCWFLLLFLFLFWLRCWRSTKTKQLSKYILFLFSLCRYFLLMFFLFFISVMLLLFLLDMMLLFPSTTMMFFISNIFANFSFGFTFYWCLFFQKSWILEFFLFLLSFCLSLFLFFHSLFHLFFTLLSFLSLF